MPQLDTVYISFIYLWTWLNLYLMTQKIKTFMITTSPKKQPQTSVKIHTPLLPWT